MLFQKIMTTLLHPGLVRNKRTWDKRRSTSRDDGSVVGAPLGNGGTKHAGHSNWKTVIKPVYISDTMGFAKPSSFVMQSIVDKPSKTTFKAGVTSHPKLPLNPLLLGNNNINAPWNHGYHEGRREEGNEPGKGPTPPQPPDNDNDGQRPPADNSSFPPLLSPTDSEGSLEYHSANIEVSRSTYTGGIKDSAISTSYNPHEYEINKKKVADAFKAVLDSVKQSSLTAQLASGHEIENAQEYVKSYDRHYQDLKNIKIEHTVEQEIKKDADAKLQSSIWQRFKNLIIEKEEEDIDKKFEPTPWDRLKNLLPSTYFGKNSIVEQRRKRREEIPKMIEIAKEYRRASIAKSEQIIVNFKKPPNSPEATKAREELTQIFTNVSYPALSGNNGFRPPEDGGSDTSSHSKKSPTYSEMERRIKDLNKDRLPNKEFLMDTVPDPDKPNPDTKPMDFQKMASAVVENRREEWQGDNILFRLIMMDTATDFLAEKTSQTITSLVESHTILINTILALEKKGILLPEEVTALAKMYKEDPQLPITPEQHGKLQDIVVQAVEQQKENVEKTVEQLAAPRADFRPPQPSSTIVPGAWPQQPILTPALWHPQTNENEWSNDSSNTKSTGRRFSSNSSGSYQNSFLPLTDQFINQFNANTINENYVPSAAVRQFQDEAFEYKGATITSSSSSSSGMAIDGTAKPPPHSDPAPSAPRSTTKTSRKPTKTRHSPHTKPKQSVRKSTRSRPNVDYSGMQNESASSGSNFTAKQKKVRKYRK